VILFTNSSGCSGMPCATVAAHEREPRTRVLVSREAWQLRGGALARKSSVAHDIASICAWKQYAQEPARDVLRVRAHDEPLSPRGIAWTGFFSVRGDVGARQAVSLEPGDSDCFRSRVGA
jgi:hypothetical protein